MNEIHQSVKFTFNHTPPDEESEEDKCKCIKKKVIPFLDTPLYIENGRQKWIYTAKKQTEMNTCSHQVATPRQPLLHPSITKPQNSENMNQSRKDGHPTARVKTIIVSKRL